MKLMIFIDSANDDVLDEGEAEKAAQELDQFVTSPYWLRTTTLPVSILGSGNADLAAKAEALLHSLKLDTSSAPKLHMWQVVTGLSLVSERCLHVTIALQ